MKRIIAGGTGFIGQALIKRWLPQNVELWVIGRSEDKIKKIFGDEVIACSWDNFPKQQENMLKNAECIINLCGANIGEKRWTKERRKEILNSRIKTTARLANACVKLGKQAPRLLNASAIGIYGLQQQSSLILPSPYEETSKVKIRPREFIAKIGQKWEAATQVAKDAGVNVVNLRFGIVLGKEGGALKKLSLPFYFFCGGHLGTGNQPFSWVSLDDLCSAIEFIIANSDIAGPINIVSIQAVTQRELAQALARVLKRPAWLPMPARVLTLLYGDVARELLLEGQHVIPSRLMQLGFQFQYPTLDAALNAIYNQA